MDKKPKIYLVPGLLTNETIYRGVRKELENFDTEVLEFIPALKNESISDYAKRLSERIDTSTPFYLMGTSFGGILCIEMTKFLEPEGVILVSSAKSRDELSTFMKQELASKALIPAIPHWAIKNFFTRGFQVGGRFVPRMKSIYNEDIKTMINSIDGHFEKWVIHQFPRWRGELTHENYLHIHGDKDRVFPFKYVKDADVIPGGSHSIIIHNYKEIADMVKDFIEDKS